MLPVGRENSGASRSERPSFDVESALRVINQSINQSINLFERMHAMAAAAALDVVAGHALTAAGAGARLKALP